MRHDPQPILRGLALAALLLAAVAGAPSAQAGTRCDTQTVSAEKVAAAAATALRVAAALDERDAPVALVARVGTDLSAQGLVYSHVGFVVRDHANGRWTAVHLLNECGSDRSHLYAQGLVNFFSDDLVNQDARIVWLQPAQAQRLAARLRALPQRSLHQPHYSLIARPGSREYQNSTAWVLELLAASVPDGAAIDQRRAAYDWARQDGFRPDRIHIPYSKRVLGGLFSANAAFTDHPVGTRLSGDYPVVTVRSIFDYLQRRGYASGQREWRNGRLMATPGPA
ncbi:DUF2145 domain-containing protein [Lysobacter sp. 5GHs7-4]|uniref:DUF2145 domain-containing protein n=1 Tax=Lysobacter sp. 5GHs7-4 TaxID=2904253 RepID=UPI001E4BB228|nr:DUF2145 domain-containing protein [Lysobacter sp. 5GHs7-4]UHQ24337.1 DUF2145 domain-containing protein [Lysobacter sp. 5GHs7-4]